MSILIAYKKNDTVYMGTDTRVIVNGHKKNELCESNFKIKRLENGILAGITAQRLTRQCIFSYDEIFTLDKKGRLTRKHLVMDVIPKLVNVLCREKYIIKKKDELPYMEANILLAFQGELFGIENDFTVIKYEDFQALGPASVYGQFILSSAKETDDTNETIVKALDMSAKYCPLIGSPYLLIDTKNQEYKLVRNTNQ